MGQLLADQARAHPLNLFHQRKYRFMERGRWIALPAPSRVVNQERHHVDAPMDGLEQFRLDEEAPWRLRQ